jgi:hypothetical protein
LWSEIAAREEYGDEPGRLEPVGGGRTDLRFTVEIHMVDADVDAVFSGRENAE